MKAKKLQKLIISLILDDLIHSKLTNGLQILGLNAEPYSLHLSSTIINLMGFEGEQNELIFQHYMDLQKRANYIDNSQNNKEMKKLANSIYNNLRLQQPLPNSSQ